MECKGTITQIIILICILVIDFLILLQKNCNLIKWFIGISNNEIIVEYIILFTLLNQLLGNQSVKCSNYFLTDRLL